MLSPAAAAIRTGERRIRMKTAARFALVLASIAGTGVGASAATLIADYQFHNSYASAVAGAPDLVPLNSVSFTTAVINGQTTDVAAFTAGSGFRMNAPGGISTTGYSIIMQVALDTTGGYRKLVDFHDLVDDEGFYNLSGLLDFYPVAAGTIPTISVSVFAQIVLTRDGTGQVTGYVDGVQQFTFADTSNYTVLATTGLDLFVDDAHTSGQEASAGRVARVRLYSGALTASEVAALTGGCYANCDGSTTPPILNVADFVCFQQHFAAGDSSANCDGSTVPPVLNVADFVCFQQQFAAGCP
jgi:hypothetical protein